MSSQLITYGFTGTRDGMTQNQKWVVQGLLRNAIHFHNGSARGADEESALIAFTFGIPITAHPAKNVRPSDVAHIRATERRPPLHPLVRNKVIVNESDVILATPKEHYERLEGGPIRSGTWSTIRYARSKEKPIIIIWPNGDIQREG